MPERAPTSPRDERRRGDPVLRREGEHWGSTYPDQLQPGDTIVVPCGYGGCDEFGWNPNTKQPVTDLGAQAHYHQRLKGAIRVTRLTLANAFMHERRSDGENVAAEIWRRLVAVLADAGDEIDARTMKRHLTNIHELPTAWLRLLNDRGGQRGMGGRRLRIAALKENDWSAGFVMYDERVLGPGLLDHTEEDVENGSDATTDREGSSATGVAIDLIDHLDGVERRAREFAFRVGLDGPTTKVLALAGRLHDLGKSDPRFQADLYGAAGLFRLGLAEFMIGPLRAKSDRASFFRRGQRAVPENFRHEALSVPLAAKHLEVEALDENERDLLLWLIGTHHGYGRPFFPPCFDPEPATNAEVMIDGQSLAVTAAEAPLRLDQGWFERAERLRWRYGPWELARLEAILRLADHAASAEEQRAFDRDEAASAATEAAS